MPPLRRAGHACHPPCEGRQAALDAGELLYDTGVGGWMFTDLPVRRADPAVLVRYAMGKLERIHHGKPYLFDVCPWCGGDLRAPDAPVREPMADPEA